MANHFKLISLLIVSLMVSFLSLSGHAISSDVLNPSEKSGTVKAPNNYDTPKFFVPPPPFSEDIFPCSDCHGDMDVNPERRELEDEHVEISEMFNHASDQRWCLDCHNPDNRDVLRLANGDLVSFEESYNLCGQCHGTIFRDWKAGIHGKRTGEWNGKKQYRLCVHCHNPHSPKFKPIKPLPPPDNPLQIKFRKLSDEEIPRNPLGNIQ
jgi:hypothetical protein